MINAITVLHNDKVGRYAVASRDLKAGEEILSEFPLVIGPKSGSCLLCLGCLKPVDGSILCHKCKWPLCSSECAQNPRHEKECEVFQQNNAKFIGVEDPTALCPQYECITPLRVILALQNNKNAGPEISAMESHCEERAKLGDWQLEAVNVVTYLREICGLQEKFSEEFIHRICGILEVNSYEVITSESFPVRGLYPRSSVLSHNCVANTSHTISANEGYKMTLRTAVPVKKGQELFVSYTGSIQPTMIRRRCLRYTKFFNCSCPRCSDPTELGTEMSTLKCNKCGPGTLLATNPLDKRAMWKCTHCEFALTGKGVKRLLFEIKDDINKLEMLDFGIERLQCAEELLSKYQYVLHPNHAMNIEIIHSLIPLYGRVVGYELDKMPNALLQRKADFCQQLLNVLDVIEPGLTRIRALTLFEYHSALLSLSRRKFGSKEISEDKWRKELEAIKKILSEAVAILSLEPKTSPSGALAEKAASMLADLSAI